MSLRSLSIAKNFNKEHEKLFHAVLSSSLVFNVNLPRGPKKISHLAVVSRIDRRVLSLFRTTTVVFIVRECAQYLRIDCAHFKTSLTSSPIFPLIQPEQLIIALCPPPTPVQKLLSSPSAFLFILTPLHLRLQMLHQRCIFISLAGHCPYFTAPGTLAPSCLMPQMSATRGFVVYFVSHFHPFNAAIQS